MTSGRWRQVEALFERAIEIAPGEREAWLRERCAGDLELLAEVTRLLECDSTAGITLTQQVSRAAGLIDSGRREQTSAGPYRLTREIGRGGMGSVYLGERSDGQYEGEVAVKLIRPGMDTDFFLDRFKRERQALARLQHPNIARLLDSGTTAEGLPYIVMERVNGVRVDEWAATERPGVPAILRMYLDVCRAVAHAHQRFIVHRDLKPGNILVEAGGTPKLLDFGICKLISDSPSAETSTAAGMLTPDYASPEQVRGESITVASDVFGLGAVLYRLLTGRPPHVIDKPGMAALFKAVCEDEVPAPSRVAADPARARALSGDLDLILLKSLQKEPERRYASAEQFAEDLRRVLEDEPILARGDTVWYRTSKFVRRNLLAVCAGAALAVSLLGGAAVSLKLAREADQRLQQVRRLANIFVFDVHAAIRDLPGSTKARKLIVETGTQYLDSVAVTAKGDIPLQVELAQAYLHLAELQGGTFNSNLGDLDGAAISQEKARTLIETALAASPANAQALGVRVHERVASGRMSYARRDFNLAMKEYAAAVSTGEPLLGKPSASDLVRRYVASAHSGLALVHRVTGRSAEGLAPLERAVTLLEQSAAQHPDGEVRYLLSAAFSSLGAAETLSGRFDSGAAHLERAAAQVRQLIGEYPQNTPYRRQLMLNLAHLADAHTSRGNTEAAAAAATEFVAIARELRRSDPADSRGPADLGIALVKAAEHKGWDRELLRESIPLLEQAVAASPGNKQYKSFLASAQSRSGTEAGWTAALKLAEPLLEASQDLTVRAWLYSARRLGESAAGRGDQAAAGRLARRIAEVADPSGPLGKNRAPEVQREVEPRAAAALASIYTGLGDRGRAAEQLARAMKAWAVLAADAGFGANRRAEMKEDEAILARPLR